MTLFQRFEGIALALLQMLLCGILILSPENGPVFMNAIATVFFLVWGIRTLVYYIVLARHMVDGRLVLYEGIILIDLSILLGSLAALPQVFILLYLVATLGMGLMHSVLKMIEIRRVHSRKWKAAAVVSLFYIGLITACIVLHRQVNLLIYIYAAVLLGAAVMHLIRSLRKTAIVYIQ